MPLYAYRCSGCGHTWERLSFSILNDDPKCPKCKGIATRAVSPPALIFKGDGWTPKGDGRTQ